MVLFVGGWKDCNGKQANSNPPNTSQSNTNQASVESQKDDPVRTLANASADLAGGIKLAISTKRQLAQEKIITRDEELTLTNILRDVNSAGQEYNNVLAGVQADTPETRRDILKALDKVVASVDRLNNEGVLHIKNEGARQRVALGINAVRAAIAMIRATVRNAPTPTPTPTTTSPPLVSSFHGEVA
jgi:hypothetical protein